MKIKNYKCKCGHDDFFLFAVKNHTGIYCSYCGKWFKWADKNEKNLTMNCPAEPEIAKSSDVIFRQDAIGACERDSNILDAMDSVEDDEMHRVKRAIVRILAGLPSADSEIKPITYIDCCNALLKMWIDNVLTDSEYNRIIRKLNAREGE